MTPSEAALLERDPAVARAGEPRRAGGPDTPDPEAPDGSGPAAAPAWRVVVAGACSSAATAWMFARLFRGAMPPAAALFGVALGAGAVFASTRSRRPSIVQMAALPVAIVAGALLAASAAGGAAAGVPRLVREALTSGGLRAAPIAFDPGWRFVLVVISTVVAAGACSVGLSLGRPKVALAVPLPILAAAAMLQGEGAAALSGGVAVAFVLAGLAVAYGADLSAGAEATAGFERRRLTNGAAMVLALIAAIVALSQARFLFPDTSRSQVVPPQRPTQPVPQPDRVLFTVDAPRPGPWRVGVLDVYDGLGWLLPPYDEKRYRDVPPSGVIGPDEGRATERATFRVAGLEGHLLPAPAAPVRIEGLDRRTQIDPRTSTMRLPDERVGDGTTYTIEYPAPPTGRDLAEAPAPGDALAPFLAAPPPPNIVLELLSAAPQNRWDRLQFVRARFYQKVIASGAGTPIDVPPGRVAQMLDGKEASPWEITAAEALLARWAGVPSRIGFGFYRGERPGGTTGSTTGSPTGGTAIRGPAEIRPKHGATWLEVYFEGFGWVPVVGVPPRARASLDPGERNENPNVQPSDELGLLVYVPIRLQTVRLLYTVVRYWLAIVAPIAAGLALMWWLLPGAVKSLRRIRRRRWAARRGPPARVAVAYAEFRDSAADFGTGARAATPLAFLDALALDDEHEELAWLVTRALWGDLQRDLRDDDADTADALAGSVAHRMSAAQPAAARVAAFAARTSLRDPFTDEIPNLWPSWARRGAVRAALRAAVRRVRHSRRGRKPVVALLALAVALTACGTPRSTAGVARPVPPLPGELAGLRFEREPIAERAYARAGAASLVRDDGLVYTLHRDDTIEGYVQVAQFKPKYSALDRDVRDGVLSSTGAGGFTRVRLGTERVWRKQLPEQIMHVWFTPDGRSMLLLVTRRSFDRAGPTFGEIVRFVKGEREPETGAGNGDGTRYDPRRGNEP